MNHYRRESNVKYYGAAGDGVTDDTAAIQAAMTAAGGEVFFPPGTYRLNGALTLQSGHRVSMGPGVTLRQYAVNTPIFTATAQDDITVEAFGAVLHGEGTWSAAWTGNGDHFDRAFDFLYCSRVRILKPVIRNCGSAGIAFEGGSDIVIDTPRIEGTHAYSTSLPSQANFQNGILLRHYATYGPTDRVQILHPNISGVAQGILSEWGSGAAPTAISIVHPLIHGVPGQHAFYLTNGGITISSPALSDIELAGVKIQAGDRNSDIFGITVTGARGDRIGSQLFEVVGVGGYTGTIRGVILGGVVTNAARAIAIGEPAGGRVERLRAEVVAEDVSDAAVLIQGSAIQDIDVTVTAKSVGRDGVLVTAKSSDGIKVRPTIRNPSTTSAAGGISGIRVESESAQVELYEPDVYDANTRMQYALFNSIAGSTVRVYGRARFQGASDTAVRATGLITEWPSDAQLSGIGGAFTGAANVTNSRNGVSSDRGDTSQTLVVDTDAPVQRWATTLTANRTVALSTIGATNGDRFRVVRTGLGDFTLDVGGLKTIPSATAAWVDVSFDGSAWVLTGYGRL